MTEIVRRQPGPTNDHLRRIPGIDHLANGGVRNKLTSIRRSQSLFDFEGEPLVVAEKSINRFEHQGFDGAALLRGQAGKLGLLVRRELHFHERRSFSNNTAFSTQNRGYAGGCHELQRLLAAMYLGWSLRRSGGITPHAGDSATRATTIELFLGPTRPPSPSLPACRRCHRTRLARKVVVETGLPVHKLRE